MISLDREVYTRANRDLGDTVQNWIMDPNLENQPWFSVANDALKEDVNKFINSTLTKREKMIIRLYYGLDKGCHTWEDIGRQLGLSRERVRQVGLAAIQKLKLSARHSKLEPLIVWS
eukprot:Gb_21211 [translate_table: standard]